MAKTQQELEAQIQKEKQKLELLQKKLKAKEKADKEKERKERTQRLIVLGGLIESYCGQIDKDKFSEYLERYANAIKIKCAPGRPPSMAASSTNEYESAEASIEGGSTYEDFF